MKRHFFTLSVLVFLFSASFSSCKKSADVTDQNNTAKVDEPFPENDNSIIVMPDDGSPSLFQPNGHEDKYNTFYGPQVKMGNGHLRSWINITHGGRPLAIGVEMTDGALNNLPTDPNDFGHATFILKLHHKATAVTPFKHIMVNWNVHGHEPPHVYDVPHFDLHFYKVSNEDRMATTDPAKFNILPPAGYMPTLYLKIPGGIPQMGAHWINLLSPEVQAPPNNSPFTHTFIYGSYDGKVTFVEPMITHAVLSGGATVHNWYRQPVNFSPTGTNYPQRYNIWENDHNGRHYVSLDQMMMR